MFELFILGFMVSVVGLVLLRVGVYIIVYKNSFLFILEE